MAGEGIGVEHEVLGCVEADIYAETEAHEADESMRIAEAGSKPGFSDYSHEVSSTAWEMLNAHFANASRRAIEAVQGSEVPGGPLAA